jgi:hypothetical protein
MIQDLQNSVASWSNATFGKSRPPSAPLNHLLKEVQEAIDKPTDIVEYADCLLLLLDASAKAGFSTKQLIKASFNKLDECKNRVWGPADENGVREHVR